MADVANKNSLVSPPYLKSGDKVAIVSTARKISREELQPALNILKRWGLDVVLGKSIGAEADQFAGDDNLRRQDLQSMLDDADVKAILCARGGYGTVRIIDALDFNGFVAQPKWIIGYSDVTALHAHIHQNFVVQTIHASMPVNFAKNTPESLESLRKALFGEDLQYELPSHPFNHEGIMQGQLIGGNLSMLYSISNSNSDVDTAGKILFIEDLDEYLYHIDRIMMQLKRAGKLDNLAGLLIGSMSDMNDNAIPFGKTAEEIVAEHISEYNYPVTFGVPAGHLDDNRALYFGRQVAVEVTSKITTIRFQ